MVVSKEGYSKWKWHRLAHKHYRVVGSINMLHRSNVSLVFTPNSIPPNTPPSSQRKSCVIFRVRVTTLHMLVHTLTRNKCNYLLLRFNPDGIDLLATFALASARG